MGATGEAAKTNKYRDKLRHQDFDVEVRDIDVQKEIEEFPLLVYGERVYVVEEVVAVYGVSVGAAEHGDAPRA